ncbi:hypothetical protein XELAEV_18039647mg [Xenopus laevis]|uniref:Uncharacterized protein n=1 Tax=Xenopus laevis TaxID=8355 RepID=A0A974C890_XENLA|nr:hypothetical protein XELAEV_18039647mg [Xenopus laevis]
MADKGWDRWPDPETGPSADQTSCQDPVPAPCHNRYFWMGTFGEQYLTPNKRVMVPYCGKCGAELEAAFKRLVNCCPLRGHCSWVGPFTSIRESLGPIVLPSAPPASLSSPLPVPDVAAATVTICTPTAGTSSKQPPKSPAARGRGRGCVHATIFTSNTPSHIMGAVASASCSSEGGSFESLQFPDWAEMDFGPLPTPALSSMEENRNFSTSPPPSMGPCADTSFWVSPSCADPKKLSTVS